MHYCYDMKFHNMRLSLPMTLPCYLTSGLRSIHLATVKMVIIIKVDSNREAK